MFDTRDVLPHATTAALLADWDAALPVLAATADAPAGEGRPVSALRVLPPVTPPGQIFGAGANYREHVVQMAVAHKLGRSGASAEELAAEAGREIDERQASGEPYVWAGVPSAVSGAYDDVVLPAVDPITTGSWSSASSSAGVPATCPSPMPSTPWPATRSATTSPRAAWCRGPTSR